MKTKIKVTSWLRSHRYNFYFDALDRLIDGKEDPRYVRFRYKKILEMKK